MTSPKRKAGLKPSAPNRLNWRDLQLVLALAEGGSTAAAAARLDMHQSSASRLLADLEHRWNAQLFDRRAHGLTPTSEGRRLLAHAGEMQRHAEQALSVLGGAERDAGGCVRLRATEGVAVMLLPSALRELQTSHPGLTVDVEMSNDDSDVMEPPLDIAVLMHRPQRTGVVSRCVARWPLQLLAHADLLRRQGQPQSLEQAADLPWIGFDRQDQLLPLLRRLAGRRELPLRFAVRSDSHLLRWQALRAGLGIGVAPAWLAQTHPELRALDLGSALPAMEVWLTAREGVARRPWVGVVFESVARVLAQPALARL